MDKENVIRVGGRLEYAVLPQETKHPAILDPDDHLSKLIIRDVHEKSLHCGVSQTLAEVRHRFWILKGGQNVKKMVRKCVTCQKVNRRLTEQKMAALPEFRCNESPPFVHVGIDLTGPLVVKLKDYEKRNKRETTKIQQRFKLTKCG